MKKYLIMLAVLFTAFLLALPAFLQIASALTISSVSVSPSEIAPGQAADITFILKNNFDRDLTDIEVLLDLSSDELPFAPYGSVENSIDEIGDGKSKEVEFSVIALDNAKPSIYKIPVKIKYTDNSTKVEKSSLISLTVSSPASIQLSVEDSVLIKGKSNTLAIKVINNGLSDIKLLTIKISEAIGIRLLSPSDAYIGELSSDNFDSAEFKIFVNENAPSTTSLPAELAYRDSKNNEIKETKNIPLRIYSMDEAVSLGLVKGSNTLTIVLVIIAIIIAFILYRIFRKRRRKTRT